MINIYCTVVTGFEKIATNEVTKKIDKISNCDGRRGNVRFEIEIDRVDECRQLRSIDNIFAVFYEKKIEGLTRINKNKALTMIRREIPTMCWKNAVKAWINFRQRHEFKEEIDKIEKNIGNFVESDGKKVPTRVDGPKFRVTCKRSGNKSDHQFTSMEAAENFGSEINNIFGWRVSLKEFDFEVVLKIENNTITVMLSLNQESMFKRNVCAYGPTTLRSTLCYSMLALAEPSAGDIIIDSMCGGGSIPIEGAMSFKPMVFIGGDHHPLAMKRCRQNLDQNLASIGSNGNICDFSFWNAKNLPLRNDSIDILITDLPFGKKLGSVEDNRILYPKLLEEWKRVIRKNGKLVVMTHDKRSIESAIKKDSGAWKIESKLFVNVGGLLCLCLRLSNVK